MGKHVLVGAVAALLVVASCSDAKTTSAINRTTTTTTDANVGPRLQLGGGQQVHWHAAVGLNICGEWQPGPVWPTSSSATPRGRAEDPSVYAGLHTHELADGTSDGIVHMEPLVREDAGNNATFGRFLQYGGWSLSDNEVALWDGTDRRAIKFAIKSRDCDGSPSKLRWALKSGRDPSAALVEQTGDINKYKMYDNDVIAIYVVAADADLKSFGDIPSEVNLHGDALSPSDFATS